MNAVKVSFRFVGENVNPQYVTAVIGIKPSSFKVKGEIVEKHPEHRYPTNSWRIDSSTSPNVSLATHIHQLLELLEPHADATQRLKREGYNPDFFCSLFCSESCGSIVLDSEMLGRIARLGASIHIDIHQE